MSNKENELKVEIKPKENEPKENESIPIYKCNELSDINNINFSKKLKQKNNSYFSKNKTDFLIQTDEMVCSKHFYKYKDKIYINFENNNEEFTQFISNIDTQVLQFIKDNFNNWFNTDFNKETIDEYLIPSLNDNNEIILEIPTYNNKIDISIYNKGKELVDLNNLKPFISSNNMIRLNGIFLDSNSIYCNWELVQILI